MNKLPAVTMMVLLLVAAPAFAQVVHQTETVTLGKITAVDLQRGTLTLDTGVQFTLAPSLQYTTTPAINQEVQVTYSEQGGQKVARIIDLAPRNINKRQTLHVATRGCCCRATFEANPLMLRCAM